MKTKILADFQICISVPLMIYEIEINSFGVAVLTFGKKFNYWKIWHPLTRF